MRPVEPSMSSCGRRAFTACLLTTFAVNTPPQRTWAVGPSSLSGKPRPETGVVLLDAAAQSGKTVSAEILCTDTGKQAGVSAVAVFESPYSLAKGNYYDVEARTKDGDSAFIQVAQLPSGFSFEALESSFFTNAALGPTGRFGSYAAPQITSVSPVKTGAPSAKLPCSPTRYVDVAFNALTQSGFEVPRRGVIAAVQPSGSSDLLLLVSSVAAARWKKGGEADARLAAESFRVTSARPSKLQRTPENDYRYSGRSLKGFDADETEIQAALARELSTQSGGLEGKFAAAARPGVNGFSPNF